MKKFFVVFAALLFVSVSRAQSNSEDIDIIQGLYGKDKKELVASFIQLEGAQKTEFWKLYDEYETARKKLGKQRIALLEKYANDYQTNDSKKIDSLVKSMFALQTQTDKLIETYYNKIKVKSGTVAAAQFTQVEQYLLSAIRLKLLDEIPFFGQLDDK